MMLHLASSRRFSLAIAAGAALRLPGINRQELTIALAEWRERETDATVRGVLAGALQADEDPLDAEIRRRLNDGDGA